MSINAKIIALSAAALLAVGGGVYAFMLDAPANVAAAPTQVASNDAVAAPAAAPKTVAPVAADAAKPAAPAPKKLTRQQLTPPPMTETEKLQKAAEQESNF